MKKLLFLLALVMSVSLFIGCSDGGDNTDNTDDTQKEALEQLAQLKASYKELLGTYKHNSEYDGRITKVETIIFAENYVCFDDEKYEFNQDTNLLPPDDNFYLFNIKINNKIYSVFRENIIDYSFNICFDAYGDTYTKVSSGDIDSDDILGTYSFNTATGSQTNGAITLSAGNWSYSGSKSNVAANSGTYTVSGSKVTFNWTANSVKVSETFSITTDSGSSTWKSDNSYTSTFLSMLFGVTATEIKFSYSE